MSDDDPDPIYDDDTEYGYPEGDVRNVDDFRTTTILEIAERQAELRKHHMYGGQRIKAPFLHWTAALPPTQRERKITSVLLGISYSFLAVGVPYTAMEPSMFWRTVDGIVLLLLALVAFKLTLLDLRKPDDRCD